MLREWRDEDLDGLAAMNAEPEVMRYIHDGHVHDRVEAAASLGRIRKQWDEHGFGLWVVDSKPDRAFVGFCGVGFPRFMPQLAASPEIGWRLARSQWGKGCATEAAVASRDDFFRTFDFDHLISIAYPGNVASHHVMEKLGMRRVEDARLPSGAAVWVHRLDRADWRPA
ncbi:MAG TPA: GNAT family N-acetyltransferase [Candidatus Limnocylindria bacterium]|nr:GNAT family N-acetyltransferase [Candidatus Limnocylindria bacterium]